MQRNFPWALKQSGYYLVDLFLPLAPHSKIGINISALILPSSFFGKKPKIAPNFALKRFVIMFRPHFGKKSSLKYTGPNY